MNNMSGLSVSTATDILKRYESKTDRYLTTVNVVISAIIGVIVAAAGIAFAAYKISHMEKIPLGKISPIPGRMGLLMKYFFGFGYGGIAAGVGAGFATFFLLDRFFVSKRMQKIVSSKFLFGNFEPQALIKNTISHILEKVDLQTRVELIREMNFYQLNEARNFLGNSVFEALIPQSTVWKRLLQIKKADFSTEQFDVLLQYYKLKDYQKGSHLGEFRRITFGLFNLFEDQPAHRAIVLKHIFREVKTEAKVLEIRNEDKRKRYGKALRELYTLEMPLERDQMSAIFSKILDAEISLKKSEVLSLIDLIMDDLNTLNAESQKTVMVYVLNGIFADKDIPNEVVEIEIGSKKRKYNKELLKENSPYFSEIWEENEGVAELEFEPDQDENPEGMISVLDLLSGDFSGLNKETLLKALPYIDQFKGRKLVESIQEILVLNHFEYDTDTLIGIVREYPKLIKLHLSLEFARCGVKVSEDIWKALFKDANVLDSEKLTLRLRVFALERLKFYIEKADSTQCRLWFLRALKCFGSDKLDIKKHLPDCKPKNFRVHYEIAAYLGDKAYYDDVMKYCKIHASEIRDLTLWEIRDTPINLLNILIHQK